MQGYCDIYKWTILKRTSPEVKCLHPTSSRREMCTLSVSNVIYHKFSHGAAFYTLNGKNVNVMLESTIFSKSYSVLCKVYTGYCGTSEIEHGLCACTADNPLAKARGLSLRTGAQTMLYLSQRTLKNTKDQITSSSDK